MLVCWCTGCGLARYLRALAAEKNGHSSSSATNYVGYVKHESVKHERVKHEKMSATGQETLNAVIFDWGVIRAYQNTCLASNAILTGAKAKAMQPRKRPNYDNSFRRLNRRMVLRRSQLAYYSLKVFWDISSFCVFAPYHAVYIPITLELWGIMWMVARVTESKGLSHKLAASAVGWPVSASLPQTPPKRICSNFWLPFGKLGKHNKMRWTMPQKLVNLIVQHLFNILPVSQVPAWHSLFPPSTKLHNVIQKEATDSIWKILGKYTSQVCAASLLAVGRSRLAKAKHGCLDHRFSEYGGVAWRWLIQWKWSNP